jgi:hypothetical protein
MFNGTGASPEDVAALEDFLKKEHLACAATLIHPAGMEAARFPRNASAQ